MKRGIIWLHSARPDPWKFAMQLELCQRYCLGNQIKVVYIAKHTGPASGLHGFHMWKIVVSKIRRGRADIVVAARPTDVNRFDEHLETMEVRLHAVGGELVYVIDPATRDAIAGQIQQSREIVRSIR